MKKENVLFLFFILFSSCQTYRNEYFIVSKTLSNIKTPFFDKKIDSLSIVDSSFVINEKIIEFVNVTKKRKEQGFFCYDCGEIIWNNQYNDTLISNDDVLFLLSEIQKKEKISWDLSKLNTNISVLRTIKKPIKINESNDLNGNIFGKSLFIEFSTPIFNKKKDLCFVQYRYPLLPETNQIIIYKKEKNNDWIAAGHYE